MDDFQSWSWRNYAEESLSPDGPFWAAIEIPYDLYGRQFSKCEDIGPEDTIVMDLAMQQDMNTNGTFLRVGMVRWVKVTLTLTFARKVRAILQRIMLCFFHLLTHKSSSNYPR